MEIAKDEMIGKKFGHLLVLKKVKPEVGNKSIYKCICDCGNIKIASGTNLRLGRTKTCSISCSQLLRAKEFFIGKKFGMLTVEDFAYTGKDRRHYFRCRCECGNETIVAGSELKRGRCENKSCGCYLRKINGLYKSRLYRIHHGMITRCYCTSDTGYKNYGGRGISVCDEWKNRGDGFLNFYNWSMKNGYEDGLTIDRIDFDGNYEPSNCRWVDWKTQGNNRSDNKFITYNGTTMTVAMWAEHLGFNRNTLDKRLRMGWSIEKALTQPVNEKYATKRKKVAL